MQGYVGPYQGLYEATQNHSSYIGLHEALEMAMYGYVMPSKELYRAM